jgi:hypothetical protein
LEKEELELFIKKLRAQNSIKDSRFGYYQDPENITGHIKANKHGLELYAAEFLEAAITVENHLVISDKLTDKNSEFFFDLVDIIKSSKLEGDYFENQKRSWKDYILVIGIYLMLTTIAICFIIGFVTAISWLF